MTGVHLVGQFGRRWTRLGHLFLGFLWSEFRQDILELNGPFNFLLWSFLTILAYLRYILRVER
jgi:hypothetical protein